MFLGAIQVRFFFYRSQSSTFIIETSFTDMFRLHPEAMPYSGLALRSS